VHYGPRYDTLVGHLVVIRTETDEVTVIKRPVYVLVDGDYLVDLDVVVGIHPVCIICIKQANLTQVLIALTYLLAFALPTARISEPDRFSLFFIPAGLAWTSIKVMQQATL
jgi:hypothetical protein